MPTVQVNDSGGIYDGSTFAATTTVAGVTGPGSSLEGVSPSVTYYNGPSTSGMALSSIPTSAGTYTVIASFAGSQDYTAANATTIFTIGKAMPTVQVNDSGGIYNGAAFAATTTVAGVTGPGNSLEGVSPSITYYNGPSTSGMALSSTPSSAGTYTVIASFVGSTDYTAASATTTFTIGKAMPTVQVNDSGGIYNGGVLRRDHDGGRRHRPRQFARGRQSERNLLQRPQR